MYYHATQIPNLLELIPHTSNHKKPLVLFLLLLQPQVKCQLTIVNLFQMHMKQLFKPKKTEKSRSGDTKIIAKRNATGLEQL